MPVGGASKIVGDGRLIMYCGGGRTVASLTNQSSTFILPLLVKHRLFIRQNILVGEKC